VKLRHGCGMLPLLAAFWAVSLHAADHTQPSPDAAKLWASPKPPFAVTPAMPLTDLSEFRRFDSEFREQIRQIQGKVDLSEEKYPLPLKRPHNATSERLKELENASSLAARRYQSIKLQAPVLKVDNGKFRALLVEDAGGSAAFYGRAVESTQSPYDDFSRWHAAPEDPIKPEPTLILGEAEIYGPDLGVFPAKGALTIAHELFHAIQAGYPEAPKDRTGKNSPHQHKWITEGLPDAIAPWALDGVLFQGQVFDWKTSLKTGSQRFGTVLGMRPWDYPLDLSSVPLPSMKIQPKNTGASDVRELASYMTSAFWRYVFEEAPKASLAWSALPKVLATANNGGGGSSREKQLLWADEAVKAAIPTFSGLYHGLPAFIAHRANYPDQVMGSRAGVFAHPQWLDYMFQDGCPLITLNGGPMTPPTVDIEIRPLAAKCLRVKWTGQRYPTTGAPSVNVYAMPLNSKDTIISLQSFHLGHHGSSEGFLHSYKDKLTQHTVRESLPVDLDPLNPSKTDGEVVLTFTNVAKDPTQTVPQQYRITLLVGNSQVQGSVTQKADPETGRPASTGKASGKRRSNPPATQGVDGESEIGVGALDSSPDVDELFDCYNGMFKQSSRATLQLSDKVREQPLPEGPPPVCAVLSQIASPGFATRIRNKMGVTLKLPRVPTGTRGPVRGATVEVAWIDPAMNPNNNPNIGETTELVEVTLIEATETYVRGTYSARFTEALHGLTGSVSGDFLQARADTEAPILPADPVDHFSTDFLLAMHYAGMTNQQLRQMANEGAENRRQENAPNRSTSGLGANSSTPAACQCDCTEFDSPRRDECATQCVGYAPISAQCVIQREVNKGRDRDALLEEINACPSDCASLRDAAPAICGDVLYQMRRACLASGPGGVTQAQVDCYLNYVVREAEEPLKTRLRRQLAEQIQQMEAGSRDQYVGGLLDAMKGEGHSCPAP
jgi:hypothetical protein